MNLRADYDFAAHLHMFRWKELNIALDVNSGAIHVLDEIAWQLLQKITDCRGDIDQARNDCYQKFPAAEVDEALGEIMEAYREEALFSEAVDIPFDFSGLMVKAICLNIAHACNMKCKYCFASQGDFGLKPSLMSLDTGKQALEFVIAKSGQLKNIEVDFFGGEPLLNIEVIKKLVAYGRQREKETGKHFNFTLTTNALLLDNDIMDFIIDNSISVILSLDGRQQVNDFHRILNNGQGSYDLVVPKIREMVNRHPVSYYVRGTFSRHNLDFADDLKHLVDLGFDCISLEPAVGADNPYSIKRDDLPRVLDEYEKLTDVLVEYFHQGKDLHFFHYNLDLQKGPCIAKRTSGCGAGSEYLVITPEGDIYPCHQFVGEDKFYMGNVQQAELNPEIQAIFQHNRLPDKECRNCWARYFCGGGCHANAYHSSGDISRPDVVSCTMHKKRIEGAIYLDLQKQLSKSFTEKKEI
ncbi:MAG: thioether cross-link-forming SCIFF peptide maturase [Syntrophomonadaceae bacterium]|jgi:uncharacterized protein